MIGQIGIPNQGADLHSTIGNCDDLLQLEMVDIDECRRRLNTIFHEVDEIRSAGQELRASRRPSMDRVFGRCRTFVAKSFHADAPATARTAATMLGYAPQRHIFPLMRSLISSSVISGCSVLPVCKLTIESAPRLCSSTAATAEQICPGVQYPHW